MKLFKQKGVTLLVSLIMLILITLLAITSFKLGTGNLQVVGNMQQRNQTLYAAQGEIEKKVSNSNFTSNPNVSVTTYASVNGGSTNDIKVVVTPKCVLSQIISNSSLDYKKPEDEGCLIGISQEFGTSGAVNSNSLCANQLWDIQAEATDVVTNAQYKLNQGTAVRQAATSQCP